jgi:hypothetical protein
MASFLEWRVQIILLAEFQESDGFLHPFGAVIENKHTLRASWKYRGASDTAT